MKKQREKLPQVSLETQVIIPASVMCRELGGETVLLDLKAGTYFGLDAIGTRIWRHLQEQGLLQRVCEQLTIEFQVDPRRLRMDLLELVDELLRHGLLKIKHTAGASLDS